MHHIRARKSVRIRMVGDSVIHVHIKVQCIMYTTGAATFTHTVYMLSTCTFVFNHAQMSLLLCTCICTMYRCTYVYVFVHHCNEPIHAIVCLDCQL